MVIFVLKPSMTCFRILVIPSTEAPSTFFSSVHLFTPSLVDLERILEAIVLSQTYSMLKNPLGIVPLLPEDLVRVCQPMSQPLYSLSNTYWNAVISAMSSTLNKGTTYTVDKKNAHGCNSSGLALKQRNSTLRHTSCTCHAKFTLRMDHNIFLLSCGFEESQHSGHPTLLSNKIRNCIRFFTFLPWKLLLQLVLPTFSPL